jgi:hypothetical protein
MSSYSASAAQIAPASDTIEHNKAPPLASAVDNSAVAIHHGTDVIGVCLEVRWTMGVCMDFTVSHSVWPFPRVFS